MAASVSLGVVRCKIFVFTLVLFCFQIVNTSPTGSPTGIMRIQNSTDNHGSLMRKLSKVRFPFFVCFFVTLKTCGCFSFLGMDSCWYLTTILHNSLFSIEDDASRMFHFARHLHALVLRVLNGDKHLMSLNDP